MFRSLPSAEQSAYRRTTIYRETSTFLVLAAVLIILAHGVDVIDAGGANWPALVIRVVWVGLLLVEAVLLRRASRRVFMAASGLILIASALLVLLLVWVTGRTASPLLPFVFVLEMIMPLLVFELLEVGLIGSGILFAGVLAMIVHDGGSHDAILALVNAGGCALVAGWLLGRALVRSRQAEEARHMALVEAFRDNEKLLGELRETMANVKVLRGMLPLCAWCRRVRSDSGYWEQIEAYLRTHSEAEITHGLCPDCEREHMPA